MGMASWVELDLAALAENLGQMRAVVGASVRVGAVIKGNAYGHGLEACLPALHAHADVLYAIQAREALSVRALEAQRGLVKKPVVVIGAFLPEEAVALAAADVVCVVGDGSGAEAAAAVASAGGPPLRVHVHLDTGLSREGFLPDQVASGLGWLAEAGDAVRVEGVLTHFADTEDVTEQRQALAQLSAFERGCEALVAHLETLGRPTALERHAAASAPALVLPLSRFDVVRVGISAYGLWPSRETRLSARQVLGVVPALRPVLAWRAPIQAVKRVPAGSYVGYGCTHRCSHDTDVAVLPVGYWDGYPRLASGRAHVLVRGARCAVLGRVMMNHIVVDVTGVVGASRGEVATLIGRDGDEQISAEEMAAWAQTIHYEIVTRLGAHLHREVVARAATPFAVG